MTILDDFRRDEARVLDRLVDGELSPHDRGQLLAMLDDEPGAWRRCALAFLESQTWRDQLSLAAVEPILGDRDASDVGADHNFDTQLAFAQRRGRRRTATFWGLCLATAASLLVAFGLGTRFPGLHIAEPAAPEAILAVAPPAITVDNRIAIDAVDAESTAPTPSVWQTVKLALAGDGDVADEIDLPVDDATSDDATWPVAQEASVSASLIEKLRQAGLEVVRRQRLVPVDMSDGRRLMVPVDQVDIRSSEFVQSL